MDREPDLAPTRAARVLYLVLAGLTFGLAVLGAFMPVLPTTPFLLLTSACLLRSSPRLHRRLRESRFFGPLIRDWEEHHAISAPVKWTALTVVLAAAAFGFLVVDLGWPLRTVLAVLLLVGTFVILRIPVRKG